MLSYSIPAPPELSVSSDSIFYLKLDSTEDITCDIVGTLRPPAWFLDNVPLSTNPGLTIRESSIRLRNIKTSQSGWYTCSATNQWGRTERDFLVIVGGECVCLFVCTAFQAITYLASIVEELLPVLLWAE